MHWKELFIGIVGRLSNFFLAANGWEAWHKHFVGVCGWKLIDFAPGIDSEISFLFVSIIPGRYDFFLGANRWNSLFGGVA